MPRLTVPKATLGACLGAAAALALAACGSSGATGGSSQGSSGGASANTVHLGLVVAQDFDESLPHYVAQQQGYFKAQGLHVTVTAFQGGADAVKAVEAGKIDILAGTGPDSPAAVAKGVPMKVFAGVAQKSPFVLIAAPNSGITGIKDLKGKKVGITRFGSLTDFVARIEAKAAGLNPQKDIKEVPLGGASSQVAGLTSGNINAFNWAPSVAFKLQQEHKARIVAHFDQVHPQDQYTVLEARPSYLDAHKKTVHAFLTAYYHAISYLKSHPTYGATATAKALKLQPGIAKKVYADLAPLLS
ncbi:MAG TPA: ABC transporter substrate-binding protein, partial [Acidimicrobiales bacterium]|nr:ABC transporter substrate-binding protein [Acidimicrobiales bacterium]